METFQAKSIQKILGITKSRYDYVLAQIGIEPDIEKVSGTGKTHLYGFEGLVEFGIASVGIDIGMKPDVIKFLLDRFKELDAKNKWEFFSISNHITIYFHYGLYPGGKFYYISGHYKNNFITSKYDVETGRLIKPTKPIAHVSVNLSSIKWRILQKLRS